MTCLGHGVESLSGERVLSKVGVVGGQLEDGILSIGTVDTLEEANVVRIHILTTIRDHECSQKRIHT